MKNKINPHYIILLGICMLISTFIQCNKNSNLTTTEEYQAELIYQKFEQITPTLANKSFDYLIVKQQELSKKHPIIKVLNEQKINSDSIFSEAAIKMDDFLTREKIILEQFDTTKAVYKNFCKNFEESLKNQLGNKDAYEAIDDFAIQEIIKAKNIEEKNTIAYIVSVTKAEAKYLDLHGEELSATMDMINTNIIYDQSFFQIYSIAKHTIVGRALSNPINIIVGTVAGFLGGCLKGAIVAGPKGCVVYGATLAAVGLGKALYCNYKSGGGDSCFK